MQGSGSPLTPLGAGPLRHDFLDSCHTPRPGPHLTQCWGSGPQQVWDQHLAEAAASQRPAPTPGHLFLRLPVRAPWGSLGQKQLGDCRKPEDAEGPHPHPGAVGHQQRPGQIPFRPGSRKAWAGATWRVRPEGSLSTWPSTERGSGSRGARPAAGEEEAEKQWFLSDPARGHRMHVDRQEPHILGRTGTPKPMSGFSLMQVGQGGGGKLGSGEGWHARQRDPCGQKCGG